MRKVFLALFIFSILAFAPNMSEAQCSICSKTIMQMGNKPATGFNTGILFLMLVPFATIGVVGYKWWKASK